LARALAHIAFSLKFWVARRVEQVEGEPLMLEAHHHRGDAALALDPNPIPAHTPPTAALFALNGQLEIKGRRSAEYQRSAFRPSLTRNRSEEQRLGCRAKKSMGV
jgi:hypothetical protein